MTINHLPTVSLVLEQLQHGTWIDIWKDSLPKIYISWAKTLDI